MNGIMESLGIQAGALGLLAYVVYWLTRSFNGKLHRLTDSVDRLTEEMRRLADRLDDLR